MKPQIFLLIAAVVLAGCIGQPGGGGTGGTAGLVITGFSPDSTIVGGFAGSGGAGTEVTFILEAKNVGERTAKSVQAKLLGVSADWSAPHSTYVNMDPFELFPADPQTGGEGQTATITFAPTSPKSTTTDIVYDIGVRVKYTYDTVGDGTFKVATPEYLRSITQAGGGQPAGFGISEFKSTGGPLVVTSNLRVPTVPKGTKDVQIQFQIQNTGGGRAFSGGDEANNEIVIKEGGDCSNKKVKLAGGKSATVFCKFTTGAVDTFVEKAFSLTIDYNYFIDSVTQVTVLKKPVE